MGLTKELGELWERQICLMGWRLGAGLGMASRMSAVEMREAGRERTFPAEEMAPTESWAGELGHIQGTRRNPG